MGKRRASYRPKKRVPPQKRTKVEQGDVIGNVTSENRPSTSTASPCVEASASSASSSSRPSSASKPCASGTKLSETMNVEFDDDDELSGFRFVDSKLLIQFIETLLCPDCKKPLGKSRLSSVKEDRVDLASVFTFQCGCKNSVKFSTSKTVNKVYEINRRFPLSMFAIGRNQAQGKRFLGNMNIPCSLNNKTWANHRNIITRASESVADRSKQVAADEARQAYEGRDITVSGDGTYQRRGFQSKNGVVTVLTVNGKKSKVLDCEVLSNHCDGCKKNEKKKGGQELDRWRTVHQNKDECDKNHTGTAAAMEPTGAVRVFSRSEEKYDLRYVNFLGDGDSKTYSTLKSQNIYQNVTISKLECCGHVQKRMGRHLTNKVTEFKGKTFVHGGRTVKGIGGQNKLTKKAILKIQGHYGAAIRKNVGKLDKMKQDIWAIYKHRNRQHDECGDWCPSKTGRGDPNKNAFPDYVCEAIRPVFETLTLDSLLERCLHGGSQNTNESFHNLIWERCPKTTFVGRKRLRLAVADASIVYNDGELGRLDIFDTLGMEPGLWTKKCFVELDRKRVAAGQIQASEAKKFARRHQAQAAAEGEGETEEYYLAGGHE